MPAFLAVSAVGPACGDDGKTTASTGTTTQTATDPTGPTTGTATTTPTTGSTGTTTGSPTTGNTGADTGAATDTGGVPNCAMYDAPRPCNAEAGCTWFGDVGQCIVDCAQISDQATCNMQEYCFWIDGSCELAIA